MVRLLSTVAVIAFAASAGTAVADCFDAHQQTTASTSQPQDGAAMSTHDGQLPPLTQETADEAKVAKAPDTDAKQDKK
jgi:hypothetical protein